jgi:hypothetical protein
MPGKQKVIQEVQVIRRAFKKDSFIDDIIFN